MDNIYALSDIDIMIHIGENVKRNRLKQEVSQLSLSKRARVSLSTISRIEMGKGCSFENLLRVLRTLGMLDSIAQLTEEEEMSPQEYYHFVNDLKRKQRKRAPKEKLQPKAKEDSEW